MLHKKQGTNTPCNKILNTSYFMFMRYVIFLTNYVEINRYIDTPLESTNLQKYSRYLLVFNFFIFKDLAVRFQYKDCKNFTNVPKS